MVHDDHDEVMF